MTEIFPTTLREFGKRWKKLFATALAYRLLSFILLTPLVSLMFQTFLAMSSQSLLADQDILLFFATPLGMVCLVLVGGMIIGLFMLELMALMAIVAAPEPDQVSVRSALGFAFQKSLATLRATARAVGYAICWTVPFLIALAVVYFTMLGEFDINYYLKEKPPVFLVAVAIGGVLGLTLLSILAWKIIAWWFAVPIVAFETVDRSEVLSESVARTRGHRKLLLTSFLSWFLATGFIALVLNSATLWLARILLPGDETSLQMLAFSIGIVLIISAVLNLGASFISTGSLATMMLVLYRKYGGGEAMISDAKVAKKVAESASGLPLTGRKLVLGGLVGWLIALAVGYFVLQRYQAEDRIDVIAHRGASHKAPENTLASVRQAIEDQTDWVEIDVQEISDGTVVVFHDSDFMKSAGNGLKIWDATLEDLQAIDIGSWFDPKFRDERVPTLEQVLDECKGKVGLYIELKYYGHDQDLERKVVELVESRAMADQVVIISLKAKGLAKIKSLRPNWKTGQLLSVYAGKIANLEADVLAANAVFASWGFVQSAKKANKQVAVWTVNDPIQMSLMIGRGVSGLITDCPDVARSVLEQRSEMSGVQRLLLEFAVSLGIRKLPPATNADP